jgi:squalene-hopene/tetraprenyl-beta-curcumene cyclase
MALHQVELPNEALKKQPINRALNWIASVQSQAGVWAAFDVDNNQDSLNSLPYGHLNAMIDLNTADVTARVLEMLGACNLSIQPDNLEKFLDSLLNEQETEGCWFGGCAVNYIYGTSGVLSALALINPQKYRTNIEQGSTWLIKVQNPDGAWRETCFSHNARSLKGKGDSTPSQTACALIGLIAGGEALGKIPIDSIEKGINYLLETQRSDGTWDESYFTGTDFPCHFYLKYHLYQQYLLLIALGQYQAIKVRSQESECLRNCLIIK